MPEPNNGHEHNRSAQPSDSFQLGDPYEYFMGRWSRVIAREFVGWLSPSPNLCWLDIGCGTGALSKAVVDLAAPSQLTGLDQSDGFVHAYQKLLGQFANCLVGSAEALPVKSDSFDFSVSGLVLNFVPEPAKALQEMKRTVKVGGTAALYVWDYPGVMDLLNRFWDTAVDLNPGASALHEGRRFASTTLKDLHSLFEHAGLGQIDTSYIEIEMKFTSFDDYWLPFLGGQGPAPSYLMSLEQREREQLRLRLIERLTPQSDGSILMKARALAIRGQK